MSSFVTRPFGDLPADWKYTRVGENVEFATGPAFDSTQFNDDCLGHKLVRGINLTRGITRWGTSNTKYWNNVADEYKKYELEVGDVVIGMDGSLVGKNYAQISARDLPALLVQRVARLRCKSTLHQRFLYYMFGNDAWISYVEIVKTNSGIPHISNGDIKDFSIPFPSKAEQQKIASILTAVDDMIESTQAQINKLKDLKTGMMQELLTKGIAHTEFKDSPVGRIPKAWSTLDLGEVTIESAFGPRFSSDEYHPKGNIGCIRTTDFDVSWDINYSTVPLAKLEYNDFKSHILEDGDLLITRSGTCGVVGVFNKQPTPMVAAAFLIRFRLTKNVNPYFIRYAMMSQNIQENIQLLASGGVQKNLSGSNLKTLQLPIPELKEQCEIVKIIDSINNKIRLLQTKFDHQNLFKKALMQDLLTGKVRVKVNPQ